MKDIDKPKGPVTPGGRRGWRVARARHGLLGLAAALVLIPWSAAAAEQLRVAATFTILADLVEQVGGERVTVSSLTPVDAEVHEWELQPSNFRDLERADLVFYNGYDLEQWMRQVRATAGDGVPVIAVAERSGHATLPIRTGDFEGDPDPHLWMDPRAVEGYVDAIRDALIELDPEGKNVYRDNAAAYRDELEALYEELKERLEAVPEGRRFLVTSEAAFPYFADAFGFEHDGIWGTNAEQEGSPRQIMRVIDRVCEWQPAAVFWESTISDRHVRSVADETGTEIAGPLYVDSLSGPGGPAASYLQLMRHNATTIVRALTE
ncbi:MULTISPECIES: metal ABC transporter solute-binding protein, Zn/Mn family [unclassified Halorhodospira]|uniref:metal ABC transporter solute-binding protein, Zn/Mn family n=1 Tax=unclassified Halorhodospira TaxID=2626748 RepID=UPI001EE8DC27|nr:MULTISPECIES: zinc ABC transporter substrate-binding protein [unclassified Halorhodospira]MCG5541037.1 zinc ABC transporter substrate-binding protein [Halorhodospira sp. M39old]MCG5546116.1 zinc ABC transporter substrate-binding protein [Halorhodospira sp. M38]